VKILINILTLLTAFSIHAQMVYQEKHSLLGSPYEITVVVKDSTEGKKFADMSVNELKRIEQLISEWIPTSDISLVNQQAGKQPVKVHAEVFELLQRSVKFSKLTDGAFDVTWAGMDRIWKFDGSMQEMPSEERIRNSVQHVGYQNLILNEKDTTVFLQKQGMKIGTGGIGQGYIADRIKQLLLASGNASGLVNISGDITSWGKQPDGKPWTVAIINPVNKEKVFAFFPLQDTAIETSGNYEKFVVFNGIRYAHIIDPRTGYPAQGVVSVSVFAKHTEIADALATGVFVLGVDVGLDLINQLEGIECIIIDDQGKIHMSKGIEVNQFHYN
jgi:thiamine biosynthesis lipoprotein